jgi:hypothetical protein
VDSAVSVAIEYDCGFLIVEVAPFSLVPKTSFGQEKMEQLLLKKYLQPYSKCNLHKRVHYLSSEVYI